MNDFLIGVLFTVGAAIVLFSALTFSFGMGISAVLDNCERYGMYSNGSEKIECSYAEVRQ